MNEDVTNAMDDIEMPTEAVDVEDEVDARQAMFDANMAALKEKVPGVEEVAARLDHGEVVARVAAVFVLHRQQVQVTLARAVETVSDRACHAIVHRVERCAANGTGQHQASNLIRVW